MKKIVYSILMPLLAAAIWGTAFVFQSVASDSIGPFSFNALRSAIAMASLFSAKPLLARAGVCARGHVRARDIRAGILCGCALCAASVLQQWGIAKTGAGKAGFLTTLYVVLVPIGGMFLGRRVPRRIWLLTAVFLLGVYLLSYTAGAGLETGDLAVLGCAVLFAAHILLIDTVGSDTDPIALSAVQFAAAALISGACALAFEDLSLKDIGRCIPSLLYTGVMSSAVAYTLQILAQKSSDSTLVTLILCLESVFAAISGALFLSERMSFRQIAGCALMIVSSAAAQLPEKDKKALPRAQSGGQGGDSL